MELSQFEKKAIETYISAIGQHRAAKDIVIDCRTSAISIMKNILIEQPYSYASNSDEVKEPTKSFFQTDFIGKTENEKLKPHSMAHKDFKDQINTILNNRNKVEYGEAVESEQLDAYSKQSVLALKIILKWYLNNHKKYVISSVTNLTSDQKREVGHLFTTKISRTERIIERETYYVVLLIDSSQSMVFPYLKDPNSSDETSSDYKNAIKTVQSAMQFAHEKALNALRGSSICKEGYLKIYQYTFNHRKKLLNVPEELSPVSLDKVIKLDGSNYSPDGMTALYDVIEESLKVVYDNYLKKTMEEHSRIDKVIIGVITDGEDTIISDSVRFDSSGNEREEYKNKKSGKLKSIETILKKLRGDGKLEKQFLVSSVLIGLTSNDFTDKKLKEIKKELNFDESVSINQADEQSIRKAFKLFSTNAINV